MTTSSIHALRSRTLHSLHLTWLLLLVLLSGCTVASPVVETAPSATSGAPAATEVATATEPATESAPAEATADATTYPYTIAHARGETTLNAAPQRVVVLEWGYAEDLLALGVQPVGMADIAGYQNWVKVPVTLAADVVDVGTRQVPNLETIIGLQPDLIIAAASRVSENYDALTAIAPTLAFDAYPTDMTHYAEMRQTFGLIAAALDRQAAGATVLAQLDEKLNDARTQIEAAGLNGAPFVLAQAYSGSTAAEIRLFTDNAFAVQVVEAMGLQNGWGDADQPYGFTTVSFEGLADLGDLHFFYVVQDDDNVFVSPTLQPLWERLEFVEKGQAYALGGDTWLFGGPLSAELLVDIVLAALLPEGA